MNVSRSFQLFGEVAPDVAAAWMENAERLSTASALDNLTEELAYIAVLAAARLESGLPFHVAHAKALGATRDQIVSTILVGLPAVGNAVISSLPIALDAYDAAESRSEEP